MSLLTTLISIKHHEEILALQEKLQRVMKLLHAKNEIETIDVALEKVIGELEARNANGGAEEDFEIDVHKLNRIPPKTGFTIKAKVRFRGKGKPMKYDLSNYNFDEGYK